SRLVSGGRRPAAGQSGLSRLLTGSRWPATSSVVCRGARSSCSSTLRTVSRETALPPPPAWPRARGIAEVRSAHLAGPAARRRATRAAPGRGLRLPLLGRLDALAE